MKSVEGVITLTQEGRFALVTDRGCVMQFVLAHNASLEPQDLSRLRGARQRVRVDYTESSHLVGYLAHALSEADGKSGQGSEQ
jgi:hypothetical protein